MKLSVATPALLSLITLVALSGCAMAPQREYLPGISAESRNGAAIVIGQRAGASNYAKALVGVFVNDKGADLLGVNGQYIKESATSELGREYWLSPGTYAMTVECYIRQAGTSSLRNIELHSPLEANHVYALEVGYTQVRGGMLPVIECNAALRDVTADINTNKKTSLRKN